MAREIYSSRWDKMSFEEQSEYRDRKLAYFVRTQIYPYSNFYRRLFDENNVKPEQIKKVEDLRRIPFTYKVDIAPDNGNPTKYLDFVLDPSDDLVGTYMPKLELARLRLDKLLKGEGYVNEKMRCYFSPIHVQFTTGRTGISTPILYARGDMKRMSEAGRRIMELAGFGSSLSLKNAVVVNAMPFAPHLGFWMAFHMLDSTGLLALNSGGGRMLGTDRIISSVENMKAMGIVGMPSYVYRILKAARDRNSDFSSIKFISISGERVSTGMKEKMGDILEELGARNFEVLGAFGFTEARKGYTECAPGGDTGYHLFPDMDYIELVDPETGDTVDEGEDGELVYTCLGGQGTCVLRFRTGDYVKGGIVYEPCPSCGRKVPRLGSEIARLGNVKGFALTKLKGNLIDQEAFFTVLRSNAGIMEWQVEIDKAHGDPYEVDVLNVYIVCSEGTDRTKVTSEINTELQRVTDVKPDKVVYLTIDDMEERLRPKGEMKEIHIIDKRPEL
ncbi:MAG: phenylacetate--CoA ligase family protein [Actinobacteria bacterium]|nr:phenylacetate--CoA ligase family protein [Actinomycetota bacterium]